MKKYFRAFEITSEFTQMRFSKQPLLQKLPKMIKDAIEYQTLDYYFADVPKWRIRVRKLFSKPRIVPNYVMTGPGKGGSSDLVSHLLLHPNVMAPLAKEIRIHVNRDWPLYYPTVEEEQRLEQQVGGPIRCGYLAPDLNKLSAMDLLYAQNPNCKVIITLRNPVDRAYSYWKWEVFMGGERLKKAKIGKHFEHYSDYISRAIDLFPSIPMETVCGPQVLNVGIYYKAVEQWINRFGKENVLVLDVADYFSNRQPTLAKIQQFLDLPIAEIPEYGKKANENPIKLPPADAETKAALAAFYKPYNQKLFDLIGKEFDWS